MMLKNRLTALIAAASIAIPALAYAGGKYSKSAGSTVKIYGTASDGKVSWDTTAGDDAITLNDDGNVIKVLLNGHKLKSNSSMRDDHMREHVFKVGKKGEKKTIELAVTHEALDKGLPSGKVDGTVKFSDGPAVPVTITKVKSSKGVFHGELSVNATKLGVEKVCIKVINVCVDDTLKIVADISTASK